MGKKSGSLHGSLAVVLPLLLIFGGLGIAMSLSSCRTGTSANVAAKANGQEITELLKRVNTWQLAHPAMKANDRNWERGTWYTGVMAAYKATGDESFLNAAMAFGERHQWQVGTEFSGSNRLFCVETWAELYFVKKDRAMIEPAIRWLDTDAPNSPAGGNGKVWYLEGGRRYADSLYGACTLAMLNQATGDAKYLGYLHEFFWDVQGELFDPATGLFFRDKRYIDKRTASGQKILWSRGNGWVIAGIARILDYLPENDPQRPRYVKLFKTMAAAIAKCQGADGLWRVNLADPAQFSMPETSGSGFFCYSLAWGINQGILDRAIYEPVVNKAWDGLTRAVSPEGKVLWGQLVAADPYAVKADNTHEYVTGTFLLAGSEMYKLRIRPPVATVSALLSPVKHPLQAQIDQTMKTPIAIQPTGLTRDDYLKHVAGQIGALRQYQTPDGNLIDPVGKIAQFAPACYAHCVATLAASGYATDPELLESGMRAMDFSVSILEKRGPVDKTAASHVDFYIYPCMLALELFARTAPRERVKAWRQRLAALDPAKTYHSYNGASNNWTLVHTGGEFLRAIHGMTDLAYVNHALKIQRSHMTPQGLYCEAGAPFAYDAFSRYFLTGMLDHGYQNNDCRDACWKGAWTSLLIQSPTGEMPTAYRSAQHGWNEAELAAIYECYATGHAQAGRLQEAGAFKRGARLALRSLNQWLRPDGSGYIVKNRFPITARHGYESYSAHVNYNLLACSQLCSAWLSADDTIAERPAPADVGGFIIELPEFNMVIANAAGNYLEYMTHGNKIYNPAGLIRIHLRGGHPQLGYSDGIMEKSAAEPQNAKVEVLKQADDGVSFRCRGETITVTVAGITVETQTPIRFPMLIDDGQEKTDVSIAGNQLRLCSGGRGISVTIENPATATWQRTGKLFNHHNGKVEEVVADGTVYRISAAKQPAAGR